MDPVRARTGLVDLTLEPWSERPPTAAEEVWELWGGGRPTEPGLWARCGAEERRYWLRMALDHHDPDKPDAESGATFHLDGRRVTDLQGFFCALGEAVNGPGGYFGWGLDALGTASAAAGEPGGPSPSSGTTQRSPVPASASYRAPTIGRGHSRNSLNSCWRKGIAVRLE